MARLSKSRYSPPSETKIIPKVKVSNYENLQESDPSFGAEIDIESLKSLVDVENDMEKVADRPPSHSFDDSLQTAAYGSSTSTQRQRKSRLESQLITFYSSLSNSTLRSSSFKEMFTSSRNFHENLSGHSEDSIWWMDVQNASERSLRLLCSAFHVHPLTVEDIRLQETREKMDNFPSYYFACLRTFTTVSTESKISYHPHTIYMIVFKEGTMSFSFSKHEHSTHVLDRMAVLQEFISISRNWIFYAFVDDIVDSFATPIAQIESEVNMIDDQIYTTHIEDIRKFLMTVEEVRVRVMDLIRLLRSKTYVLKSFHNHRSEEKPFPGEDPRPSEDILIYIGDVQDHVATMKSSLKQFEGLLKRAQGNCLTQLDINNDNARRRVVKFLGRVTLLTLILAILNIICGLFSMNVNANTTLYATNSLKAFWIIISLEVVVAIGLFFLAKKYRFF